MGIFLYRLFILDGNFQENWIIEKTKKELHKIAKKIGVTKSSQEGSWSDPAPESALLNKAFLLKLIPNISRKKLKKAAAKN